MPMKGLGGKREMRADVEISLKLFNNLADLAERHGVTDTQWAKAAWPKAKGNTQSRIAEIRQIGRVMAQQKLTQAEASTRIKRRFTLPKFRALTKGLVRLVGSETVSKELITKLSDLDLSDRLHVAAELFTEEELKKIWPVIELILESREGVKKE